MPYHIPMTDGPDIIIWGADRMSFTGSKTFTCQGWLGDVKDSDGNWHSWTRTDVDGNVWSMVNGRLTIQKSDGTYLIQQTGSHSSNTVCACFYYSEYDDDRNLTYGTFTTTSTLYSEDNRYNDWYWMRFPTVSPTRSLSDWWANVNNSMNAGITARMWDAKITGNLPYSIIDLYSRNTNEFRVTPIQLTGGSGITTCKFGMLRAACPSMFFEPFSFDAPDPYEAGGHAEPYVGDPTFDNSTDVIPVPDLPTFSFTDSGFTRIYNPSIGSLQQLSRYMWTDQTFLQTLVNHAKQLLENPIDAIIALNLLPCSVPNGASEEVKVLYIPTGVYMPPVTNQFVNVDCGTVVVDEYYASALDYSPYTTIELVLPFIGQVSLDTDEVMGHTLHVRYRVDVVTGMCVAIVSVDGTDGGVDVENVMYQFTGHCAISMPITSADFSTYVAAAIGAAKTGASVALGAAAGTSAAISDAIIDSLTGAGKPLDAEMPSTPETAPANARMKAFEESVSSMKSSSANYMELARDNLANTVSSVMTSKPVVEHSGGFTGNSGYLGVKRPYLIIKRPRMCNPEEYGKFNGRPAMITMNLGDLSDFTQVQQVQLTGIPATNPELGMISSLLKAGVIM